MAGRVGAKGNLVIEKSIRDHLGVQPGWETVQLLRDGYVEIYFLPPMEPGASAGILGPVPEADWLRDDDALHEAIDQSIQEELAERYSVSNPEGAK
jgi:hypothetical protein